MKTSARKKSPTKPTTLLTHPTTSTVAPEKHLRLEIEQVTTTEFRNLYQKSTKALKSMTKGEEESKNSDKKDQVIVNNNNTINVHNQVNNFIYNGGIIALVAIILSLIILAVIIWKCRKRLPPRDTDSVRLSLRSPRGSDCSLDEKKIGKNNILFVSIPAGYTLDPSHIPFEP